MVKEGNPFKLTYPCQRHQGCRGEVSDDELVIWREVVDYQRSGMA
jgi:hypothetical protein